MRLDNFLILVGRTFLSSFFLVNFFNIIPLDFSRNSWFVQISMLFVDTASLLLLGLCSLKICAFMVQERNIEKIEDVNLTQTNNIQMINNFSKYSMYFFLFLAITQFFLFFNGIKQLNNLYMFQYNQIEQNYQMQKRKISSTFNDDNQSITNDKLNSLPNSLTNKKNKYIKDLDKANSKTKFLLLRGNIKVFLMSLVWSYGLFKLSSFKYRV